MIQPFLKWLWSNWFISLFTVNNDADTPGDWINGARNNIFLRFVVFTTNSYDLKHFPCLKLNANYAYGLLAMVAHNILRWVSVMTKPDKPHYSKKLRRRFISIPAKLVHHARQVFLKMMDINLKEVLFLRETLGLQSKKIPLQFSTA